MKSGNLNFLEHSGPLQACNGTALSFFITCRKRVTLVTDAFVNQQTHGSRISSYGGYVFHEVTYATKRSLYDWNTRSGDTGELSASYFDIIIDTSFKNEEN